jgi:hypothetical protein
MGRSIEHEVRPEMFELADIVAAGGMPYHEIAERIRQLANDTYRNSYKKRKADPTAKRMTNALADEIQDFAEAHPDWSNRKIGRHFGVDGGRVTDALSGKVYSE